MSEQRLVSKGLAHHRAGRFERAESVYRDVLRRRPGNLHVLYLLGTLYGQTGRAAEAVAALRQVVARQPDAADAYNSLGVAEQARGELKAAADAYRRVIALKPDHVAAHNNLASVLQEQGDLAGATAHLQRAIALDPGRADAFLNLGVCLRRADDVAGAVAAFERAAALRPGHVKTLANLVEALREAGQPDHAVGPARQILALTPDDPAAHLELAHLLEESGDMEGALAAFDGALALDPEEPAARADKAAVLEKLGRREAALALVEGELAGGRPSPGAVRVFASLSRNLGRTAEALEAIERALAGAMADGERQRLHFGAGDLYDRAEEYDRAFDHYRQANALSRYPFDPDAHRRRTQELIDAFSRDRLDRLPRARHGSELPVFVLGMPRSGTTLTEQIIASHPEAFGAGELVEMGRVTAAMPEVLGVRVPFPQCVGALTAEAADRLAAPYLARLQALGGAARRVTDKMPENFLNLGLIRLVFPRARVIHVRRDPVDTCLSCYFQPFGRGHAYSFDLRHLGLAYREYARLMRHWRQVLPDGFLEVRYECLVGDQEAESRRIIEHLGLPWDEACLRFHEARRPVLTQSYDQVRRPLYTSSVARWRHYEKHLGPLLEALGPDAE